jgi:hypothetical protein
MATSKQERDQIIEIISKENTAIEALTTSLSSVNSYTKINSSFGKWNKVPLTICWGSYWS